MSENRNQNQLQNSEALLCSPPLQESSKDNKLWLAGLWLLPGMESEPLRKRFKMLEYHWDDRSKLETDIESIKSNIGNLKKVLYPTLNTIHQVNYSTRYWDILVGEWIYLYCQILFDRWAVMETAFKTIKNPTIFLKSFQDSTIPFDTVSFQRDATLNHDWNAKLMTDIYNEFSGNSSKRLDRHIGIDIPGEPGHKRASIKRKFVTIFSRIYVLLIRKEKAIFVQTPYLSKLNSIKLCFKIRALLYFESTAQYAPIHTKCNLKMRQMLSESLQCEYLEEPFFSFLLRNIELYFPAIYLEEYENHKLFSEKSYFDYFPRKIVTANSHYSNECWKSWAASSVEKGGRILVLQHGGHYGHSKFSLIQDYEIELADKFLSWGWTIPNNEKVIAVPANKLISLTVKRKRRITCLVVTFETPTYAYWLASFPIGPQVFGSKEMTLSFLLRVENALSHAIRVRAYPVDYGLSQKTEFQLKFPQLSYSPGNRDFKADLEDARIVVFNYFSTAFIEALKMDVPSVAFIDPAHLEVNDLFKDIFTSLVDVGILHHSSESCANFVKQTWDGVETWWSDSTTFKAKEEFLELFGYTGTSPINELSKAILDH